MSLLFRVVYAAHANGTHHKLALDALARLRDPHAEGWRRVFLKHVALYLEGSKDPDNKFKDFKNHVLHVEDGYWGGAPEKVESWYRHLVTALRESRWGEAAYAAGVLSHYYTDPIHPFHTAQSEAENNIHRACEWSINRAYDGLRREADEQFPLLRVETPTSDRWLSEMTIAGAEFSHRYYAKLIAHYDIRSGVVDPPAGLDPLARKMVAELIAYAAAGFARILDRAFVESGATPPEVSLSIETIVATLKVPLKMVQKRLADAADRAQVQRMYDELLATGTVEENLPEDDRRIRDLHTREVLAAAPDRAAEARAERMAPPSSKRAGPRSATLPPAPAHAVAPPPAPTPTPAPNPKPATLAAALATDPIDGPVRAAAPADSAAPPSPPAGIVVSLGTPELAPRIHLAPGDDLEFAPSIGRKTAERLAAHGLRTVAEFLARDPAELAKTLATRTMSAKALAEWQAQARLVMAVPGLRGTHAQLLVGAGFRDTAAILAADPGEVCGKVLAFAATTAGRRLLRDGAAPDLEKIQGWIASAAAHAAAA